MAIAQRRGDMPGHEHPHGRDEEQDEHGRADNAGPHPQLIRIETNAGHGAGTPVAKLIEQSADIYAFTLYEMGYRDLPRQP